MNWSNWKIGFGLLTLWLLSAPAVAVAQAPSDETISFWVVEAMREDPRVQFSNIRVGTEGGIVTLKGSVATLAESSFARLIALKIQGVRGVVNRLDVETAFRSDNDISQDVRRRILQSSSIRTRGLLVKVNAAQVQLNGTVGSQAQREQAGLVASEVWGVKALHNDLQVEFANQRPDTEIGKDIEAALRRDVYLTTLPINIRVNDGLVVLEGTVGNAYQKERATDEALRVDNVRGVENRLAVEWWRERATRGEMPMPSDDQLHDSVYAELDQDPRIDASEIAVTASGGHVTLRGSVATFYQRQIAEQDALSVAGALWVSNLLAVREPRRNDAEIISDVQFGLQTDSLLRDQRVVVRVSEGVVTLLGSVNTSNQKVQAATIASRVRGVRAVSNKIEVRWFPSARDAALETRINARLLANWETRWVAGKIKVAVNHGKVTLNGTVNSWAQWREAGRVAYLTNGVWAVDNRLTVANVAYRWERWYSDTPAVYNYDPYPEYRMYFFERRF